jgi:hypothetical protein
MSTSDDGFHITSGVPDTGTIQGARAACSRAVLTPYGGLGSRLDLLLLAVAVYAVVTAVVGSASCMHVAIAAAAGASR